MKSTEDIIWLASVVIRKNLDYETFKDSDYCSSDRDLADAVWMYVDECREIGTKAFKEKYVGDGYKFFPI